MNRNYNVWIQRKGRKMPEPWVIAALEPILAAEKGERIAARQTDGESADYSDYFAYKVEPLK